MRKLMQGSLLSAATCAAAMAFNPAAAEAIDSKAPTCDQAVVVPSQERALMKRVRHLRDQLNYPHLRGHRVLQREARWHSARLARGRYLAHTLSLPFESTRPAGQNLARASNARVAMRLMLLSAPHREVLLDRAYRYIGIGAMVDCQGQVTYTLNLMGRR